MMKLKIVYIKFKFKNNYYSDMMVELYGIDEKKNGIINAMRQLETQASDINTK